MDISKISSEMTTRFSVLVWVIFFHFVLRGFDVFKCKCWKTVLHSMSISQILKKPLAR